MTVTHREDDSGVVEGRDDHVMAVMVPGREQKYVVSNEETSNDMAECVVGVVIAVVVVVVVVAVVVVVVVVVLVVAVDERGWEGIIDKLHRSTISFGWECRTIAI